MNNDVITIYQALGFEKIELEDGQTVLGFEFTPGGAYALLTDTEGNMPKSVTQEVIFACYTVADSFEWSSSFKNSSVFKDLWVTQDTIEAKLAAIQKHRELNQRF